MKNLARILIRPSREFYQLSDLGPTDFIHSGKVYTRIDFDLTNQRGLQLKCSWFKPKFSQSPGPCLVYCHGNCGSRKDSLDIAKFMLPQQISVLSFDFSGSGISEGEFISLGYYESWDIKTVVEYLSESEQVTEIILWGRSMGAVSVILYASCDPRITMMVLDSPFQSLKKVMKYYMGQKSMMKSLYKFMLPRLRKSVMELAKFDVFDVEPTKYLGTCKMPLIMMHGVNDNIVPIWHSHEIFKRYKGEKYLLELRGGHNSGRPESLLQQIYNIISLLLESGPRQDSEELVTERGPLPSFTVDAELNFQTQLFSKCKFLYLLFLVYFLFVY